MLFKEIEELKQHHGRLSLSFNFEDIAPYIREVEEDYIVDVLSREQYNALLEDYEGQGLSPVYEKLLQATRDALAPLALHYFISSALAVNGQTGLMQVNNDELSPAPKWLIDRTMADAYSRGMRGIDRLYKFLEENKDDYPLWVDSESFTIFKSSFINTTKDFEKFIKIGNSRRTFLALKPILERVEQTRLESALSVPLYDEIKEQILDDGLSDENAKLLTRYIQPALAHLTMSQAFMDIPITLDEKGAMLYEEEKKALPLDQKQIHSKNYQARGENHLADLQKFLYQNADDYPAFKDSDSYNPEGDDFFTNNRDSRTAAFL
jgi:hypothetical protein